jgi:hypothetical protein
MIIILYFIITVCHLIQNITQMLKWTKVVTGQGQEHMITQHLLIEVNRLIFCLDVNKYHKVQSLLTGLT